MSAVILLALALGAQSPAAAAPPVTTSTPAAAPAPGATKVQVSTQSSDQVCKMDQERGSRISTRVCRSKAEWAALEAGAREFMKDRRDLANPGR